MPPIPPRLLVIVGEIYERTEIADQLIEAIAHRMRLEVQDLTVEVIGPRQFAIVAIVGRLQKIGPKRQRRKPVPILIAAIRSGVPIGSIRFTVPIEVNASKKAIEIRGESAKRFERAFVSYASEDRVSVLEYAQVLNVSGIEIFQDVLSLEPGERWKQRLYVEIDRSDLFLLFWSKAASESKWVIAEAEHALRRYNKTGSQTPVIRPILLEGPPIPEIPATLKSIHFNDKFRYMILGAKAEANARRQATN